MKNENLEFGFGNFEIDEFSQDEFDYEDESEEVFLFTGKEFNKTDVNYFWDVVRADEINQLNSLKQVSEYVQSVCCGFPDCSHHFAEILELNAICDGLEWIKSNMPKNTPVTVYLTENLFDFSKTASFRWEFFIRNLTKKLVVLSQEIDVLFLEYIKKNKDFLEVSPNNWGRHTRN